jgi:hypothetical protein
MKNTALMQSLKSVDKQFIHVVFLDFLYYLVLLFAGSFYIFRILPSFFHMLDVTELLQAGAYQSTEEFFAGVDTLSLEYNTFLIATIGLIIILIANYCLFKYLIWNKILKKHEKRKPLALHIAKFAGINTLIFIKIILVLVFSWYVFTIDFFNIIFFFILPLAAVYKLNLIHPLYAMHKDIKKVYKAFIKIGIKQCYKFIIPYVIMAVGLYILISFILPLFIFLPSAGYFVVYVLSFAAYFSWTKYYLLAVIKKCK